MANPFEIKEPLIIRIKSIDELYVLVKIVYNLGNSVYLARKLDIQDCSKNLCVLKKITRVYENNLLNENRLIHEYNLSHILSDKSPYFLSYNKLVFADTYNYI